MAVHWKDSNCGSTSVRKTNNNGKASLSGHTPKDIPVVTTENEGVEVKIIAGESLGRKATIETHTPILYLDIHLKEDATFTQPVPKGFNGFLYVWKGSGFLSEEKKPASVGQIGVLGEGYTVTITGGSKEDMHVLLVASEPLREAVACSVDHLSRTLGKRYNKHTVTIRLGNWGRLRDQRRGMLPLKLPVRNEKMERRPINNN